MGLILPKYLVQTRRFKCSRCSFGFIKDTPSRVEKCPKCTNVVFDREYKQGDALDPYSASKLRWYQSEDAHVAEIKNRKTIYKDGKPVQVVTDDKGRIIEEVANIPVAKNMGKSNNVREAR